MELLVPFIYGFAACFIGALPFGAINLSVVSITVKRSYKQGRAFALGSSLVEIVEAYIALTFGIFINKFLENHQLIPYTIATAFFIVGTYFIFRKSSPSLETKSTTKNNNFIRGVIIALGNPQAIPFWLFALAFIAPYNLVQFIGIKIYLFLSGVFFGKLIALLAFAKTSHYLGKHLNSSSHFIDYTMGGVFLSIGLIQIIKQLV